MVSAFQNNNETSLVNTGNYERACSLGSPFLQEKSVASEKNKKKPHKGFLSESMLSFTKERVWDNLVGLEVWDLVTGVQKQALFSLEEKSPLIGKRESRKSYFRSNAFFQERNGLMKVSAGPLGKPSSGVSSTFPATNDALGKPSSATFFRKEGLIQEKYFLLDRTFSFKEKVCGVSSTFPATNDALGKHYLKNLN